MKKFITISTILAAVHSTVPPFYCASTRNIKTGMDFVNSEKSSFQCPEGTICRINIGGAYCIDTDGLEVVKCGIGRLGLACVHISTGLVDSSLLDVPNPRIPNVGALPVHLPGVPNIGGLPVPVPGVPNLGALPVPVPGVLNLGAFPVPNPNIHMETSDTSKLSVSNTKPFPKRSDNIQMHQNSGILPLNLPNLGGLPVHLPGVPDLGALPVHLPGIPNLGALPVPVPGVPNIGALPVPVPGVLNLGALPVPNPNIHMETSDTSKLSVSNTKPFPKRSDNIQMHQNSGILPLNLPNLPINIPDISGIMQSVNRGGQC
ncbi:hypothetical protein AX774_g53 [Zancudomyces culisetae]|uniref:Uncharacterized protein n=1 Tax=Zancudomyces culisetae TaxID=1213189 RepID=A0A1R1PZK7_ZANCU|nr:hypothetical protein AX774_g53 [Zancudomyces culisetae]|eukprot:OMH86367.1 hypothetical protein AX774_g53 [Zancudomyces culisetae]